jgi:hypothetical protein
MKNFEGWVFKGITCNCSHFFVKLLVITIDFMKLKNATNENLNQEIWRLKERPESFVQKLPRRARYKLSLTQYDENYFFEPPSYPRYTFYETDAEGNKKEVFKGGKEVRITFFNIGEDSVPGWEFLSGHKYQFSGESFEFRFMHPLSGKDPWDKLYQLTKDMYCCPNVGTFLNVPTEFTGKFCRKGQPFTSRQLVPYILNSMDKQFDFLESDGQRMQWYTDLRKELENPTLVLNKFATDDIGSVFLTQFYQEDLKDSLDLWEGNSKDYLLGEDE